MPNHRDDVFDSICESRVTETMLSANDPLIEAKDLKAIKSSFQVTSTGGSTFIIVLAVHPENNDLVKIRCEEGTPIGGYVYDNVNNCYYVRCVDWTPLGYVNCAYWLRMKDNQFWRTNLPLPETLIWRYLEDESKDKLKAFKACHKGCDFQYLQLID